MNTKEYIEYIIRCIRTFKYRHITRCSTDPPTDDPQFLRNMEIYRHSTVDQRALHHQEERNLDINNSIFS